MEFHSIRIPLVRLNFNNSYECVKTHLTFDLKGTRSQSPLLYICTLIHLGRPKI